MTVLLYGAYGFTGRLIAEEAVERGMDPIVAGRNEQKTARLGRQLGCEWRAFGLDDPPVEELHDIDVVLNCAGPFVDTAPPMVEACLDTETHYLDITGELAVFEQLAARDRDAEDAGICLLPGVGFDVVPTDCLAARLKRGLPDATSLRLGIDYQGPLSGGTLRTLIEHLDSGGMIRTDGKLVPVPPAWNRQLVDFGNGSKPGVSLPLGDVSTAYYTTGIPNIETYVAVPPAVASGLRLGSALTPALSVDPIKRGLQWIVGAAAPGPTAAQRERNVAYIWGEASSPGSTVSDRLSTPEPYALTIDSATSAVQQIAAEPPTGFETPAVALGEEFVLGLDGVELLD